MVKIMATTAFSRWMKRAGIRDADLLGAVAEMSRGLIDANLGGDVYKKRFGVAGRGAGQRPQLRVPALPQLPAVSPAGTGETS